MSATIATLQEMFKQQLDPQLKDQLDWLDVLLEDTIGDRQNNPKNVKLLNNKFEITSLTGSMYATAGAEWANLLASDVKLEKMYVTPKYVTASYRIGHEAIQTALSGGREALRSAVELYGMEIRKSIMRAKGRFLRWDGSGIVQVLPAWVVTGATVTLSAKAPGTVASRNIYALDCEDVFQPWMQIEFGTDADFAGGTQTAGTILTVDSPTAITLTGSVTIGAASGANNRGGTNADTWYVRIKWEYGNAPMGILKLIDDNTFYPATTIQNVVRATSPYMKSATLDKANATTIIKDFRDLYNKVRKFNDKVKYWLVSEDVFSKYTDSITITVSSNVREQAYNSKLGVWHTGLMFAYGSAPISIMQDQFLPYGVALLVDPDQMFFADLFADAYIDDGILTRVTGTKVYETVRAAYYEIGTYSSRKLGWQLRYQTV